MADPHSVAAARAASLMVGSRLVNMAVGLVTLPVLLGSLGLEGFAAWALLLALAAGFSLLELGMPPTLVRFIARPLRDGRLVEVREVVGRAWALLALSFGAGAFLVWLAADRLVSWLQMPGIGALPAGTAAIGVFAAVALRSFLQTGTHVLVAARRFRAVSAIAIAQPLFSNLAAMGAALAWRRLDLVLAAYWASQLLVVAAVFAWQHRTCTPLLRWESFRPAQLGEMFRWGFAQQLDGWAQFLNFQFDKFLIAAVVGLPAVPPYEVANRAVLASRSIPATGAESFLPIAMVEEGSRARAWRWYRKATRLMAYGAILFIVAPMAVAPLFLPAWVGEPGHAAQWIFAALAAGTSMNAIAVPAMTLAQVEGRPRLIARAALVATVLNVPLSLALVLQHGALGAASGTAVAMSVAALVLVFSVHRHFGRPMAATARLLARFGPATFVCLAWAAVVHVAAPSIIQSADASRLSLGLAALGVYAACVASLAALEMKWGGLSRRERRRLASWIAAALRRRPRERDRGLSW